MWVNLNFHLVKTKMTKYLFLFFYFSLTAQAVLLPEQDGRSKFLYRILRAAHFSSEHLADEMEVEAAYADREAAKGSNSFQFYNNTSAAEAYLFTQNGGWYPELSSFFELRKNLWGRSLDAQVKLKGAELAERKVLSESAESALLRRFSLLYIDWIYAAETADIFAKQVDVLKKITELSGKRYAKGDDTKLTMQQVKIRLVNAETQKTQTQMRAKSIAQRIELESRDRVNERADSKAVASIFASLLKNEVGEKEALANRVREARLNTADANVQSADDNWGPRLDFIARAGATNYTTSNSFAYSGKNLVPEVDIGLELNIPIYDSHTHNHALRSALLRRNAVEERNKAESLSNQEQIIEWESNKKLGELSEKNYEEIGTVAVARRQALEKQFAMGMITLFDLLNATEDVLIYEKQRIFDAQQRLQSYVELAFSKNRLTIDSLKKVQEASK